MVVDDKRVCTAGRPREERGYCLRLERLSKAEQALSRGKRGIVGQELECLACAAGLSI